MKPLKVLHPSATRWLSLKAVVKRNLERFDELKLFFSFQSKYDNNATAKRILHHLEDPMTLSLLNFLKYILTLINDVNRQFQSEDSQFCELYSETETLRLLVLGNLCGDNVVKSFKSGKCSVIEILDTLIKRPEDIYIGFEAEESEEQLDDDKKRVFRTMCKDFYVELATQIAKRFDFQDPVLKNAALLNLNTFLKQSNLSQLMKAFPHFVEKANRQALDTEFRTLKANVLSQDTVDIELTWPELMSTKRRDGNYLYPELRSFVRRFLIIPHSSACVERIFSLYNANKTKPCNRLSPNRWRLYYAPSSMFPRVVDQQT